jgi:MFS family permease
LTALAIFVFGFSGISYLLTFYWQPVKGYTPLQTGIRYLPLALGTLIGAMLSERLVSRLGTKRVTTLGFIGAALVLIFAVSLKISTPYLQLGAELFFVGFFLGCIVAPASTMLMGSLPKAKAGIGAATTNVVNYVFGSIGIATLGSILSSIYSSHFLKAVESIQGLPAALVDKASDSVGAALNSVKSGQIPPDSAGSFVQAARESFMDGWQIVAIILCAIFAAGAAICLRFMPHWLDKTKDTAIEEARLEDGSESECTN